LIILRQRFKSVPLNIKPFKSSRNCWEVKDLSYARLSCPEPPFPSKSVRSSAKTPRFQSHWTKWPVNSRIKSWDQFSMTHSMPSPETRRSFMVSYFLTLNMSFRFNFKYQEPWKHFLELVCCWYYSPIHGIIR